MFWVLAGVITVLALYPALQMPELEATGENTQYLNHASAYSTLLVVGAVGWGLKRQLIVGVTMFAIFLELGQLFSPGRETTIDDMLASFAGVVLGIAIVQLSRWSARRWGLSLARADAEPPFR